MSDVYGLSLLAEALSALLYGRRDVDPWRLAARFRELFARTLLDRGFLRSGLLEAYLDMVREAEGLAREVLGASGSSAGSAEVEAGVLVGRLVSGEDCVPVRVVRDFRSGRLLARRGGLICLDSGEAIRLALAGLVEPISMLLFEGRGGGEDTA